MRQIQGTKAHAAPGRPVRNRAEKMPDMRAVYPVERPMVPMLPLQASGKAAQSKVQGKDADCDAEKLSENE
jgi:hypothetical protein